MWLWAVVLRALGPRGPLGCVCVEVWRWGMSCRSAWAGLGATEPRVPSSTPRPVVPSPSRGRVQCPVLPTQVQHYGTDPLVNMFQSQTHSHLPRPPRPQKVPSIPGGNVCPLGHWQGTLALRCVTCRGPVWMRHRRRVTWALLHSWQPSFRAELGEQSREGLRLTQPAAQPHELPRRRRRKHLLSRA